MILLTDIPYDPSTGIAQGTWTVVLSGSSNTIFRGAHFTGGVAHEVKALHLRQLVAAMGTGVAFARDEASGLELGTCPRYAAEKVGCSSEDDPGPAETAPMGKQALKASRPVEAREEAPVEEPEFVQVEDPSLVGEGADPEDGSREEDLTAEEQIDLLFASDDLWSHLGDLAWGDLRELAAELDVVGRSRADLAEAIVLIAEERAEG